MRRSKRTRWCYIHSRAAGHQTYNIGEWWSWKVYQGRQICSIHSILLREFLACVCVLFIWFAPAFSSWYYVGVRCRLTGGKLEKCELHNEMRLFVPCE